jgi:hypothetical protein
MHRSIVSWIWSFFLLLISVNVFAQKTPYIGFIGGVATLSADGGAQRSATGLSLSSYAPANGGALNVFAGIDLHDYFSLQANFIWNRNTLHLSSATSSSGTFYQEDRSSSQQAGVFDFLIYFRKRSSRIRPYLGTGGGVLHFISNLDRITGSGGSPALPPPQFSATMPVFRSHVGIDIKIRKQLSFRYSFSELIARNPISPHLSPPGPRGLANFQNLFGFVTRF